MIKKGEKMKKLTKLQKHAVAFLIISGILSIVILYLLIRIINS